jgi:hypothetical protein
MLAPTLIWEVMLTRIQLWMHPSSLRCGQSLEKGDRLHQERGLLGDVIGYHRREVAWVIFPLYTQSIIMPLAARS